jgi:hypothetical protein
MVVPRQRFAQNLRHVLVAGGLDPAGCPWVTASAPPRPDQRFALLDRLHSSQAQVRAAFRQARSHPYISLGVAAGSTAAILSMSAGVASAATASPVTPGTPLAVTTDIVSAAAQASPLAAAASAAQPDQAAWHPTAVGQPDPAQAFGAIPAPAALTLAAPQAPAASPTASGTPLATASHVAPAVLATPSGSPSPAPQSPAPQSPAPQATAQQTSAPAARAPASRPSWSHRHAGWHGHAAGGPGSVLHQLTQHPARRQWPYQMYDSTTPTAIPGGRVVATYATGPYAVPASQVAGRPVFWIDTRGTDPGAQALDVEPGDATPTMAATWAWQRLHADPGAKAIIYTMRSEWPATQAAIGTLPRWMQNHVRWWIADPTGYQHVVPGSNATQWYWGTSYDISTVLPGF